LRRAEAAVTEFRTQVRADMRTHVARGGQISASAVDAFIEAMDAAARELTRGLRG
jgi:hypothetical protein